MVYPQTISSTHSVKKSIFLLVPRTPRVNKRIVYYYKSHKNISHYVALRDTDKGITAYDKRSLQKCSHFGKNHLKFWSKR